MWRIAEQAARGAYAGVKAQRELAGDQVHDAAQRRRAVQRGARSLHHLDPLHAVERHEIPVDAAAVALIGGDAVHEQQHTTPQPLHVARGAADVHLAVQELNAGGLVHGFVNGGDGTTGDVGLLQHGDAGDGLVEELGALGGGDDDLRLQLYGGRPQKEVALDGVGGAEGERVEHRRVPDVGDAHDRHAGRDAQPVTTLIVREAPQAGGDVGHGRPQRLSAAVPDRAVHHRGALRGEPRNGGQRREQGEGEGEGEPSLHGHGGM